MKHKINWAETRQSPTGKEYKIATLENGTDISVWPDFSHYADVVPGGEVEGEIRVKGKYKNLVDADRAETTNSSIAPRGMAAAQQRKAAYIEKAQDKKEESIAYFNSVNAAIELISKRMPAELSDTQKEIVFWRDWFYNEWKNWAAQDENDKRNPF